MKTELLNKFLAAQSTKGKAEPWTGSQILRAALENTPNTGVALNCANGAKKVLVDALKANGFTLESPEVEKLMVEKFPAEVSEYIAEKVWFKSDAELKLREYKVNFSTFAEVVAYADAVSTLQAELIGAWEKFYQATGEIKPKATPTPEATDKPDPRKEALAALLGNEK